MTPTGKKRVYSAAEDATIRRMRAEGAPWDAIAGTLEGRPHRQNVIDHAVRDLGMSKELPAEIEQDPVIDREPLRPGSPETWGAIIAGTCLDGTPYPRWRHP
jgi:hypothetical protein